MKSDNNNHDYSVIGASSDTIRMSIKEWAVVAQKGIMIPITVYLKGASMEPLIRYMKDPVRIIPVTRKLQEGDVVLFESADGRYVLHRVFRIINDKRVIQTWGDNCYHPDPCMPITSVKGIAVSFSKNGKTINLDSNEQRQKGLEWLNSKHRRYVWFTYKRIHRKTGRLLTILGMKGSVID